MHILALDASTKTLGVAIATEDTLCGEINLNVGKTHSQRLLPVLENLFVQMELSLRDISAIAVTVGPGSFTGLRIGLATAKGLAQALAIPVVPIITLDALAFKARGYTGFCAPVLDARKNEIYCAFYDSNGQNIFLPAALPPAEFFNLLSDCPGPINFLGDGAKMYWPQIYDTLGKKAILLPEESRLFMASAVAMLGMAKLQAGEVVQPGDLLPVYLRASEAEVRRLAHE